MSQVSVCFPVRGHKSHTRAHRRYVSVHNEECEEGMLCGADSSMDKLKARPEGWVLFFWSQALKQNCLSKKKNKKNT